jgi:hypothetical protein
MPAKLTPTLRQTTYVFGRLNLVANYDGYQEKETLLFDALRSGGDTELFDAYWSFADVERLDISNEIYIYGVMVKSATRISETVDKSNKRLKTATIENSVIAKSPFFLNVKTGIIAFYASTQIPVPIFQARFKSLVAHREFMANADIQMIEERDTVLDKFSSFDKIMRVSIILHPSNPSSHDLWKDVDKRIHDLNANTIQEIIDGKQKSGGLDIDALSKDATVKSKITMAEDGYGSAKVSGIKDGKSKSVVTGKKPLTAKGASIGSPQSMLDTLADAFVKVFKRFL